jgi:hypothetical protein
VEGDVSTDEFRLNVLTGSDIHAYTIHLETGEEINISALGEWGVDMEIEIRDAALNLIVSQNDASANNVETLAFNPTADDEYKIYISDASRGGGSYVITVGDEEYPRTIMGLINYGDVNGGTINLDEGHYWFFEGAAGDRVTVDVTSQSGANLLMSLYDMDEIEVGDLSLVEQIQDQLLPGDGWYLLEFEEWGLDENAYQLTLVNQ